MKKNPDEIWLSVNKVASLLGKPRRTIFCRTDTGKYVYRIRPGFLRKREIQLSSLSEYAISKYLKRPLKISAIGIKIIDQFDRKGFVPQDKIKIEIKDNVLLLAIDLSE
jgi:hypothetical protein